MARHGGVLAIAAKARQTDRDQAGVELLEGGRGVEAEFLEHAGAERVDEDIGGGDQGEQDGEGGGRFEVEGDGAFVRCEEVGGGGGGGTVDAQDGGAVGGEEEAAEWTCRGRESQRWVSGCFGCQLESAGALIYLELDQRARGLAVL